ncbi:uncharacterized protein LOC111635655 [Centruroides sculpturatus]|uniref:uncharacterized protein LOC111615732 n=1 Tax=Centruroides sculpturatus TaxID=218467 RepID=UPI000C6CB870|nr:uncharacterized protein LOC111615732 [Centruroides sculpturatus]XP_023236447.1 uncharacterized protein LOC111635655 [Centruroides sculpturatus]
MYPSIKRNRILATLKTQNCQQWIIDMVTLVLENNYFVSQKRFFRQCDGIPMGSIIGPILAELSMCNIDHDVVNIKGIIELYRYVDDCFLIYDDNIIQADKILEHVNKIDNDIKFDLEPECNCQLPFLDILVTRHKDKTTFKKYKKPCTIDSVIHFTSEVPTYIKKNTFYMYLDKIMQRTTYDTDISNEIEDIIKTYLLNGYSKRMISNWLNKKYVNAHKQPIDSTAYKFLTLRIFLKESKVN